jgi:broad specificity phosphatase PhoE
MLDYDSATVIPFSAGPLLLNSLPVDTIQHSSLPRARHTAQLAFGKSLILVEDSDYREFERKTLQWFNIKMPTGFWTTSSRILWFLRFNDKNIETFSDAKYRALTNVAKMEFRAKRDGAVIIVAHGLHNKYVKKYLKKAGWKLVFNNGNGYLSVKVLALPIEIR